MDVYGKAPTSKTGEYFRRNVWGWHPLWEYCSDVWKSLDDKVPNGHTNDGDGLDAADSKLLAGMLEHEMQVGATAEWCAVRQSKLDALPDEVCSTCGGAGKRQLNGEIRDCNGCEGKKVRRPSATWYTVDQQDVVDFVAFLKDCGGFEIC